MAFQFHGKAPAPVGGAPRAGAILSQQSLQLATPAAVTPLGIPTVKAPAAKNSGGYLVVIPAGLTYAQFPAAWVPPGATVRLRAHNGANAGNTNPIAIVGSADEARSNGPADYLNPDDETIFPVDNLGRIWIRGTAGDGCIASIREGGQ